MMEAVFLFFGMACGVAIGMEYIPHQLKKRNPKVTARIKRLLEETNRE